MWLAVPWRRDPVSLGSNACAWDRLLSKFEQKVWPLPLTHPGDFSSLHPRTVGEPGRERGGPGPQPFSSATATGGELGSHSPREHEAWETGFCAVPRG